jgi:phage tail tape-measure protein
MAGKTLLGFVIGTALVGFMVGAAFVSFVTVATTADAYIFGGGSGGASSSIGIHNSATRSLTDSQRNNWNKPLESERGLNNPATFGADNGGTTKGGVYPPPRRTKNQRNGR